MYLIECRQGTPEWLEKRAGLVTASRFEEALSVLKRKSGKKKKGDPTDASDKYRIELAIERINKATFGEPPKGWHLDRGHAMEDEARMRYEMCRGVLVDECGIAVTDDGVFGYSTDGFVNDDGMIEIKAPTCAIKIEEMWRTGDVSEYIYQMQGGLWITGRKWVDFVMYAPMLKSVGKDLFVKRIYRDENFIEKLESDLLSFSYRVNLAEQFFRSQEPDAYLAQEPANDFVYTTGADASDLDAA